MLKPILFWQLKVLMYSFLKKLKVVSTDHQQASNLTSLVIIFFKLIYFSPFFFVINFFYFINPRHPLYILVPAECLVFYF